MQTKGFQSDYAMYRLAGFDHSEAYTEARVASFKSLIEGFEELGAKFYESGTKLDGRAYCIMTLEADKFTFYLDPEGMVKYHAFQPWH